MRGDDGGPGVEEHLPGDAFLGRDDRQHRHPNRLVILLVAHGQRLGVRRCPKKMTGTTRSVPQLGEPVTAAQPTSVGMHPTAPPHHVLPGPAFEDHGVDTDVEAIVASTSSELSRLAAVHNTMNDAIPSTMPKMSAARVETACRAIGRRAVRFIF